MTEMYTNYISFILKCKILFFVYVLENKLDG